MTWILDWTLYVGLAGMLLILIAFILNVFTKMDSSDTSFLVMNLVGSLAMSLYAYLIGSIPTLVLNSVWAGSAAWGIVHHKKKRAAANRTPPSEKKVVIAP